jgi:transposase
MVGRRISEEQRWQIIGMHTTGMSFKAIGRQMGYRYTVVSRLVRTHTQTNNVKDLPRSGRPRVTSDRDDRALQRLVRRMPFANILVLKQHNRRLSTRTVRNRLKSAGLKSRRPTSTNTLGMVLGMVLSTTWLKFKDMAISVSCNRRPGEGLETQTYSLCPKEHPANCPLRWRLSNGLGCIAHDCKLDLVTIQGNLTGDQYIRDVLQPVVCPPFRQPPTSYKACVYG